MSVKTAKITACDFTGEWKAPNGDMIYYHQVALTNGDAGSIGTAEKFALKIAVGQEIVYTINGNKLKLEQAATTAPVATHSAPAPKNQAYAAKKAYGKKPEDFLGYAYSYAKDLVVAGKGKPADIKQLKQAAEEIYAHIVTLLNQDHQPPE